MPKALTLAIDGNEANVTNRVGSNVYAYELLTALEKLLKETDHSVTVVLASEPIADLPKKRKGWQYQVIGPQNFWTQWALPLHLWQHRNKYDVFLTPSHYAPRFSPVPYVSAVMDTAYLEYPDQFTTKDRVQLRSWTKYSVKHAQHVIAISEFTKASIIAHYGTDPEKISVVYPAVREINDSLSVAQKEQFFATHRITEPYILFVGTLQPRKNVKTIIEAFEKFSRKVASETVKEKRKGKKVHKPQLPKLVLAGKVGWLATDTIKRIEESPFTTRILLPGFITEEEKKALYQSALCSVLVGIHEGFGIPPLEAMKYGTIPIVADATSLPEVVGKAGLVVDPFDSTALANHFFTVLTQTKKVRAKMRKDGREQAQKFDWEKSAKETLKILQEVAKTDAS